MLIYTSLSPFPSFDTIGSVSVGSFLSIPAPRRQALKYFFWMCTSWEIIMKVIIKILTFNTKSGFQR